MTDSFLLANARTGHGPAARLRTLHCGPYGRVGGCCCPCFAAVVFKYGERAANDTAGTSDAETANAAAVAPRVVRILRMFMSYLL